MFAENLMQSEGRGDLVILLSQNHYQELSNIDIS